MYTTVVLNLLGIMLWENVAAVTVSVEQGVLKGEQKLTITGDTTYNSFKGIPYAAAPTGHWRFKAPRSPPPWKGIKEATQHGNVCPQFNILENEYIPGSEDCLFLNVYSPCLEPKSLLAVMVYIHGGGFGFGSGNDDEFGPDYLMDTQSVVVVTINYRLDTFGFLCLDTKEVPGNAGMKDQVFALRWVQSNIKNFGGDPNKVTIFGQSAGAVSCTLHALSPMSRGLFHRVIAMSGVPLSEFSIEFEQTRRAYILSKKLGFETTNATILLQFLQTVPVKELVNTNSSIIAAEDYIDFILRAYYFVPVVEKDFGQERFLVELPVDSVKKGRNEVDVLLGYTSAEGLISISFLENSSTINNYDRYPEVLVSRSIFYQTTPKQHLKLADLIKEFYTGTRLMSLKTIPQFVNYITDSYIYPVNRYARRLSNFNKNRNNIYLYEFASMSERNVISQQGAKYGLDGVAHIDDLQYVFYANKLNLPVVKNSTSYEMVQQFVALLTNFAIFGNPTPDSSLGVIWPKYCYDCEDYVIIGENLTLAAYPRPTMISFWKSIYKLSGLQF